MSTVVICMVEIYPDPLERLSAPSRPKIRTNDIIPKHLLCIFRTSKKVKTVIFIYMYVIYTLIHLLLITQEIFPTRLANLQN